MLVEVPRTEKINIVAGATVDVFDEACNWQVHFGFYGTRRSNTWFLCTVRRLFFPGYCSISVKSCWRFHWWHVVTRARFHVKQLSTAHNLTTIKSSGPDFVALMRFRTFIFINGQIGDNARCHRAATIRYTHDALSRSMDIEL